MLVSVAILVDIGPQEGIAWIGIRTVRPAISVTVKAAVNLLTGRTVLAGTSIGLCAFCVVALTVTIAVDVLG